MDLSICSFSFHRLLAAGKQDIFRYITDCQELGCTLLDPWNSHLAQLDEGDLSPTLSPDDEQYLARVLAAANEAHLPFGCIAVDGAHIYEADETARQANRTRAYRWLQIAEYLDARQVRIDAGGPEEMPEDVFKIIVEGFQDLVQRGRQKGVEIVIENHWGPSPVPENLVRILEAVDGLGLLFDTNNWAPGQQEKGWTMCARYARCTHIKTFEFDAAGNEPSVDIPRAIKLLQDSGYDGCWGIESCPRDGDEYAGARQTIALIQRCVQPANGAASK